MRPNQSASREASAGDTSAAYGACPAVNLVKARAPCTPSRTVMLPRPSRQNWHAFAPSSNRSARACPASGAALCYHAPAMAEERLRVTVVSDYI